MNFVSYDRLYRDIQEWSGRLPHFDVILGIPRSGMVPAMMLALHRNVPCLDMQGFFAGRNPNSGFRLKKTHDYRKILVLDDSCNTGTTIRHARKTVGRRVGMDITFGCVYLKPGTTATDYHCRHLTWPRIFQWNLHHHVFMEKSCYDIDGVLCPDQDFQECTGEERRYVKHITESAPLVVPTRVIHTLVTSRMEKYREVTSAWLSRHNIRYRNLIMHPAKSPEERRRANDHAERKSEAYRKSGNKLFVESSARQAARIHQLTRKPVLCTQNYEMYR